MYSHAKSTNYGEDKMINSIHRNQEKEHFQLENYEFAKTLINEKELESLRNELLKSPELLKKIIPSRIAKKLETKESIKTKPNQLTNFLEQQKSYADKISDTQGDFLSSTDQEARSLFMSEDNTDKLIINTLIKNCIANIIEEIAKKSGEEIEALPSDIVDKLSTNADFFIKNKTSNIYFQANIDFEKNTTYMKSFTNNRDYYNYCLEEQQKPEQKPEQKLETGEKPKRKRINEPEKVTSSPKPKVPYYPSTTITLTHQQKEILQENIKKYINSIKKGEQIQNLLSKDESKILEEALISSGIITNYKPQNKKTNTEQAPIIQQRKEEAKENKAKEKAKFEQNTILEDKYLIETIDINKYAEIAKQKFNSYQQEKEFLLKVGRFFEKTNNKKGATKLREIAAEKSPNSRLLVQDDVIYLLDQNIKNIQDNIDQTANQKQQSSTISQKEKVHLG